jgi:hypothetical protein
MMPREKQRHEELKTLMAIAVLVLAACATTPDDPGAHSWYPGVDKPNLTTEQRMQLLQMENEGWNREADREVLQRAIWQSGINAATVGAAQNSAAQSAARANALNNLQQQQHSFQLQQQLRQLNQSLNQPPNYTYTPKPVGITVH